MTLYTLWFNTPLLISMPAVGILPFELLWNIDFFLRLLTGLKGLGITSYMFKPQPKLFLRSLSLFHVFLPILWIWYIRTKGYDRRALKYFIIFGWIVLFITYYFTDSKRNINAIFSPLVYEWDWISLPGWIAILALGVPLFVCLPLHELFKRNCKPV